MRFMILVKASKESEAGAMPSAGLVTAMGKFNEEMVAAGVLLAGEGLHPTTKGVRLKFSRGKQPSITNGPFQATNELVAGFWMIQVASKDEALAWASRIPFTDGEEVEIRQVFETSDFPADVLPPEAAAREEALREELQRKAAAR